MPIPETLVACLERAHPSWRPVLAAGLERMDPAYLAALAADTYLPTEGRLFAAFTLPLGEVRYVLVGEGPYPREQSATGVCFMDGAVDQLWCDTGLSKPVNRATSLRNFMKMLLVAAGELSADATNGDAMAPVVRAARDGSYIATLNQLQDKLTRNGFLLLNASLVFRPHVAPAVDARAWLPFLQTVLQALAAQAVPPKLVLWGKIAEQLKKLPESERFEHISSEHPYNLSFIRNREMQALFGPMELLSAKS
ncbi:MAG TPA: uracil-DNA glycosylase [Telluria sp.]